MPTNAEQLNSEVAVKDGFRESFAEDTCSGQSAYEGVSGAEIEQLIQAAHLDPTLENAEAIFALTKTPAAIEKELNFKGHSAYRFGKRTFDICASAAGMILLSWLIVGTALAVKITSPGPIVFKQKRVGKDKQLFDIYKFRTMRIDTPDLPSHMIDANDWLTPIGAIMRRLSLDELPQLWNILKGDMSAVGPRPALWSQFDLVAERDLYGANGVRPGLTGWAQINGRDELSIKAKAMRDGEYVTKRGFLFDLRCFFGTFAKLITGSGVVEETVPEPKKDTAEEKLAADHQQTAGVVDVKRKEKGNAS